MITSNGVYSVIDKTIRILGTCYSTINHILTNDTSNITFPCFFLSDLSDYFLITVY